MTSLHGNDNTARSRLRTLALDSPDCDACGIYEHRLRTDHVTITSLCHHVRDGKGDAKDRLLFLESSSEAHLEDTGTLIARARRQGSHAIF